MSGTVGALVSGFFLGAGLIIAIGAQNAFILRQGLKKQYVFILCLICSLSDAALIVIGVAGLGHWISKSPQLITLVTIAGSLFLGFYGLQAAIRVIRPQSLDPARSGNDSLRQAIAACLAFTYLNPHVYLDTVVLVGGLSATYAGAARVAFAIGAVAASFTWFFALGYGARLLTPLFARPSSWRVLDGIIALIMFALAGSLLLGLGETQPA